MQEQALSADINRVSHAPAPELSIIIPTFNERDNVPLLVDRLRQALGEIAWEVIFVDDDSPDQTAELVKTIGASDARIRCIRRIHRRGLAGACLEGMLASQARFVAVMDADLQHEETLLVPMLSVLREDTADLVVGTRYAVGTAVDSFSARRQQISVLATRVARGILRVNLSDPMSGFFMLKRDACERFAPDLSQDGFKILLDIVITARGNLRIVELPYRFRKRHYGESKLDARVALEYGGLILAKVTNGLVSVRFLFFCLIGAVGVLIHLIALVFALNVIGVPFIWSHVIATFIAIASNYVLNNALTYRDRRLVGRAFLTGLVRFYIISILGAVSNIGIGSWLFSSQQKWWLAGLAGAIIGVVWNYLVASALVWDNRARL